MYILEYVIPSEDTAYLPIIYFIEPLPPKAEDSTLKHALTPTPSACYLQLVLFVHTYVQ